MTNHEHFYTYEARWLGADRLYRVTVASGALWGGRVGGQLVAGLVGSYPDDPEAYITLSLASRYDSLDPLHSSFLRVDKLNFRLSSAEIQRIVLRRKKHWWTGPIPNSGSFVVYLRDKGKRHFILLGRQDVDLVEKLLYSVCTRLEARQ